MPGIGRRVKLGQTGQFLLYQHGNPRVECFYIFGATPELDWDFHLLEAAGGEHIAKTTIYRHWPSRESLLLEACSQLSKKPEVPDTGSLSGDLLMLACGVAKGLQQRWATVLPSIIDAAERDKSLCALQSRIHAQMRSAFITVIDRGQTRGELSASEDPKALVASVMGPLMYRRYFSRESLDEGFAREVVERALRKNA